MQGWRPISVTYQPATVATQSEGAIGGVLGFTVFASVCQAAAPAIRNDAVRPEATRCARSPTRPWPNSMIPRKVASRKNAVGTS
jgi:hypothetical protein